MLTYTVYGPLHTQCALIEASVHIIIHKLIRKKKNRQNRRKTSPHPLDLILGTFRKPVNSSEMSWGVKQFSALYAIGRISELISLVLYCT